MEKEEVEEDHEGFLDADPHRSGHESIIVPHEPGSHVSREHSSRALESKMDVQADLFGSRATLLEDWQDGGE